MRGGMFNYFSNLQIWASQNNFLSFQINMKSAKVHFSQETKSPKEDTTSMDPELASRLYEDGGFLILKDLPEGTEFGIDMNSWNTGY